MKIAVTGVAGFIGSNLTEALLAKGHTVIGIDNLSQGDLLNISESQKNPNFQFLKLDILEKEKMQRAVTGCEIIFHLAAYKIPRYGNAFDTLNINTHGTENVIDCAVAENAHLIFASTSDVYGKNPKSPFCEDDNLVLGPPTIKRWSYALSKAFDEQLLFAEAERRKLKFTVVRFFGGYGPNQNLSWWGGPQSVFIEQALDDKDLTIHGDGSQMRSFTYIADHVAFLTKIIEEPRTLSEVLNLGNDREISILNLAKMIWKLVRPNQKEKIQFVPYESFGKYEDVMRRVPDLTKTKAMLGVTPSWSLELGLPLTIEWQKKRRSLLGRTS